MRPASGAAIKIGLEGPRAGAALDELLAIAGIDGQAIPVAGEGAVKDVGGTVTVIGEVVGAVGGLAGIVDAILGWRDKWLKRSDNGSLDAVIEDAKGNRLALLGASPEQITAVLKTIAE